MLTLLAQGAINFSTRFAGVVDAPIFREDGVTGAGAGFVAQLFFIDHDSLLKPLFPATTFRGTNLGQSMYVNTIGTVEVPGFDPGAMVTLRLRAWEGVIESGATTGTPVPSWDDATRRNESNDILRRLGGDVLPPSSLAGLQGFTIPEPQVLSLLTTPAIILALRRMWTRLGKGMRTATKD